VKAKQLDAIERGVGRRIAEVRAEKGLTQEELAGLCDLSVQQVRRIELTSNTRLTVRRLVEVADVLGVSPEDLLKKPQDTSRPKRGRPAR
jgi:transcriptional regulator with XRE-family HTH domain